MPDEVTWNRITPGLLTKLIITPQFLADLVSRRVICNAEKDEVQAINTHNPQGAKSCLINIFRGRSETQYQGLIQALQISCQGGALEILEVADISRDSTGSIGSVIQRLKMEYNSQMQVEYTAERIETIDFMRSTDSRESTLSTESTDCANMYNLTDVYEDPRIKETWRNEKGFKMKKYATSEEANLFKVVRLGKVRTLIVGIQLIGKSALMKMMCYRWAIEEQGTHIPLLIYIDYTHEGEDFESTINNALDFLDDDEKMYIHNYRKAYPKDVIYAIDGIDHFKNPKTYDEMLKQIRQSKCHFVLSTRTTEPGVSGLKHYVNRILEIQSFTRTQAQIFRKRYKEHVFPKSKTIQNVHGGSLIPGVCKYECNYLYDHSSPSSKITTDKVTAKTIKFLHERENQLYLKRDKESISEAFQKLCEEVSGTKYQKRVSYKWLTSNDILGSSVRVYLVKKVSCSGGVKYAWLSEDVHKSLSEEACRQTGKSYHQNSILQNRLLCCFHKLNKKSYENLEKCS